MALDSKNIVLLEGGTTSTPQQPTTTPPPKTTPPTQVVTGGPVFPNNEEEANQMIESGTIPKVSTTPPSTTPPESVIPDNWTLPVAQYDKDAEEMAGYQYQQDVAAAEQSQLTSRQNIEKNANQANLDYSMLNYQQNQNIEKMGWSGGSYLDAKMQQEYLQASIQADLYGQLELQKYGYETEMAKARMAFAANQKQLAMQYLKEEYEKAFTLTQQTGIWIDPTIKDRLSQWDIAKQVMEEYKGNENDENYTKAKKVFDEILASFALSSDAPLTPQGVDVLRQYLTEQNLYSSDTLSAEQIKNLKIETENAQDLAQREKEKQDEVKNIYTYTDANGKKVSVNMLSGDKEGIRAVLAERPDVYYSIISSFTDKARAEYEIWKQESGNAEKSFETFLNSNKGVRDQYFKQAFDFAKSAGESKFVFNGKTYYTDKVGKGTITKNEETGTYHDQDGNLTDEDGFLLDGDGNRVSEDAPAQTGDGSSFSGDWQPITSPSGAITGITYNDKTYNIADVLSKNQNGTLEDRLNSLGIKGGDDKTPTNYPSVMESAEDIDKLLALFNGPYKSVIDKFDLSKITNNDIIEVRNGQAFKLLGLDVSMVTLTQANDNQERAIVANFGGAKQIDALIEWKKSVKESSLTDDVSRKVWWLADWFQKQYNKFDLNK